MQKKQIIFTITVLCLIVLLFLITAGCVRDELRLISEKLNDYEITLSLHTEDNTLSGHTKLRYTNGSDSSVSALEFRLIPNAYREDAKNPAVDKTARNEAYPDGLSYGGITVTAVKIDGETADFSITGDDEDVLSVPLGKELFLNDSTEAEITYSVRLANVRHRLGYSDGIYNLANAYPVLCYEENGTFIRHPYTAIGDPFVTPAANYSVTFIVPEGFTVAHSGDLKEKTVSDGSVTYRFEQKCIRDFSLCASEEFSVLSAVKDKTEIKYFYRKDSDPDSTLRLISDCFGFFSSSFGKYPYGTYCVAETTLAAAGGMEYPNLVFVSDDLKRDSFNKVVIHETAHQWWYGLVGNDQFNEAWLDEGLAEYSVILFYKAFPDYGDAVETLKNSYKRYKLFYDVIINYKKDLDTSMSRPLTDFPNAQSYAVITYLKGMLMTDSLYDTVGEKRFSKALRRYFEAGKYSIATPELFISCFEKEYGSDMKKWFSSWLNGNAVIG